MPTTTYTPIASVTLSASSSSVVFSGLPQSFRDVILVADTIASGSMFPRLRVNGSATGYSFVQAVGTSSAVSNANTETFAVLQYLGTDSGAKALYVVQFMDYSTTDKHKTILSRTNDADEVIMGANRWASTTAISSIEFATTTGSFASGSTFNLFGVIA